jgi:hypothetical protein
MVPEGCGKRNRQSGRQPSDAHHLKFLQPRALGRRVSDEFAVPLCRPHHRALHRGGDEAAWWNASSINPVVIAHRLWQHTRLDGAPVQQHIDPFADCTLGAEGRRWSRWTASAT